MSNMIISCQSAEWPPASTFNQYKQYYYYGAVCMNNNLIYKLRLLISFLGLYTFSFIFQNWK